MGVYRQRVSLASGRFAMIDDGLGFQLVPWRPALGAASRSTGIRRRGKWRRSDLELWKENRPGNLTGELPSTSAPVCEANRNRDSCPRSATMLSRSVSVRQSIRTYDDWD